MFSKIICVCGLAGFLIAPVFAQNSLSGYVKDKRSGELLPFAELYLTDLKRIASADTGGRYIFQNLPTGKYILEVRLEGYASKTLNVLIQGPTQLDIALDETQLELSQVVVTGVSHATEIKRNPVPIVVIDKEYISRELSTNVIDAIARTPGINAVTTGPNVSKPFIRGLGYNRILTLYDGIRMEGQQWGDEHGIEVDEFVVDRVEVIKGPASLTYGSDALAGVVNILPPHAIAEGKILGSILGEYQSNNGMYAGSANVAGNNKGISWMFRGTHKEAADYRNKIDGRVYGTAFHETDLTASVGLDKAWGFSHLSFALFDDLQEIPDGSRDSATRRFTKQLIEETTDQQLKYGRPVVSDAELNSYKINPVHQHVQHYGLYSHNNFELGRDIGKIAVNLGYQLSTRREFSHPIYIDTPGLYLFMQTVTYDVKYSFPEFHGWESMIGINGMYQDNRNHFGATEFIIPDYHLLDVGPFAFVKKSLDKLDVSAGIRYDVRSFTNSGLNITSDPVTGLNMRSLPSDTGTVAQFGPYKNTFRGFSGSVGATYNFSDNFLLKANIARGFRAPNIAEIAANGVHPGTGIYQIGNPDFLPEFSLQEDIGFFFNSRHVSLSIEAFNNDITNYIYNQKLINSRGMDSVIVPGTQTFKFVASHAQLYGGEVSLDVHPHPLDWLHFENALSLVYAQNVGQPGITLSHADKYLPFIPPLHTRSELRANFKKRYHIISNSYARIEVEYYARQDRVLLANNTETPTPGYTLLNAGVGGDIVNRSGKVLFSLSILGNNLMDVAYQSHLSRLKYFEYFSSSPTGHYGIYNMGRNIGLKFIVPFSVKG